MIVSISHVLRKMQDEEVVERLKMRLHSASEMLGDEVAKSIVDNVVEPTRKKDKVIHLIYLTI